MTPCLRILEWKRKKKSGSMETGGVKWPVPGNFSSIRFRKHFTRVERVEVSRGTRTQGCLKEVFFRALCISRLDIS